MSPEERPDAEGDQQVDDDNGDIEWAHDLVRSGRDAAARFWILVILAIQTASDGFEPGVERLEHLPDAFLLRGGEIFSFFRVGVDQRPFAQARTVFSLRLRGERWISWLLLSKRLNECSMKHLLFVLIYWNVLCLLIPSKFIEVYLGCSLIQVEVISNFWSKQVKQVSLAVSQVLQLSEHFPHLCPNGPLTNSS